MPEKLPTDVVLRELRLLVRKMRRQKPPATWNRIAGELGVSVTTAMKYGRAQLRGGRKSALKITERQREYVAALIDGKNKTQAAKAAGCTTITAAHQFVARANHSPAVQDYMQGLLKAAGLDDKTLARRLEMCTRATKVAGIAVNKNTGMIQGKLYHPDYHVQHQAIRTAFELSGQLGQKDEKGTSAPVQVFLTTQERVKLEILTGGPLAFPVIELGPQGEQHGDVRTRLDGPVGGHPAPAARDLAPPGAGVPASRPAGD